MGALYNIPWYVIEGVIQEKTTRNILIITMVCEAADRQPKGAWQTLIWQPRLKVVKGPIFISYLGPARWVYSYKSPPGVLGRGFQEKTICNVENMGRQPQYVVLF